jgi:formate dehydrogenase subunit delta
MEIHRLVKMVNDIANFFASEPDHQLALEGIAGHIRRFWDPRMRRKLMEWVEQRDGEGLSPLALEALRANRDKLTPPAVTSS